MGKSMTYDISNLSQLSTSASNLANYRQSLTYNTTDLQQIITSIQANWQNSNGEDLNSILTELRSCIDELSNTVDPVLGNFVGTLNKIVMSSGNVQSKTIGSGNVTPL